MTDIQKLTAARTEAENYAICIEECAELQKEITKILRYGETPSRRASLIEEAADVIISINCVMELLNARQPEVHGEYRRKMQRNLDRLQEERNEKAKE